MKKLTKKQIKEFARIYIGSQMVFIDGGCVSDIAKETIEADTTKLITEITEQGMSILRGRPILASPEEILEYVRTNF